MPIPVLFSGETFLAVNKPPGVSVHEAPGPGGSLLRELRAQLGCAELTPVHRLDKDASGVLLLGRSKAAAAEVQRQWETAVKTYWTFCAGVPVPPEGVIDAPILENQTGKPERLRRALEYFKKTHPGEAVPPPPAPKTSAVHPAGRPSRTAYRVLQTAGAFASVEVQPQQGRMHQIRVHLAYAGWPLAVDPLYGRPPLRDCDLRAGGSGRIVLARMPLHASKLTVRFRGRPWTFEAPLPSDLAALAD